MTRRLRLPFERAEAFQREFDRNIAKGGVFVPGATDAELREVVEVELVLAYCGKTSVLAAEVVHVVPVDIAPSPAAAGVAVQFLRSAPEVRSELAEVLASNSTPPRSQPRPRATEGGGSTDEQWVLDDDLIDLGPDPTPSVADASAVPAPGATADGSIEFAESDAELGGDLFGAPTDFSDSAPQPLAEPEDAPAAGSLDLDPADRTLALDLDLAPATSTRAHEGDVDPAAQTQALGVPGDAATVAFALDAAGDDEAETERFVERRRAPRSPARVPTRVEGANARIEGVTRDLSETGALISADASEFPVGKDVRLSLQHPENGESFEVAGRVVRHVETEGTVAAVSVLFDVPPGQKDELADLVHAAQRVHHERAASGISGRIEELGIIALIQMLGRSAPVGTLAVRRGAEEGVLAFEQGTLRYARLGATRGLKALARIARWPDGSFEFHAHVAPLEQEDEPLPLEAALLELARRADEASAHFGPTQRFRIDRDALAAADGLDKTEEAVLDLAAAGFTVRRIHDVIPEGDAQVSAALQALVERGVLLPG